jgi:uncharacterized spore protein YtfJ
MMQSSSEIQPIDSLGAARIAQESIAQCVATAGATDVYGQPITHGDTLVIPAAEVLRIFGMGYGGGTSKEAKVGEEKEEKEQEEEENTGSGGGGGGKTFSRPVAVIVVTPQGVKVEPVIDLTKIVLAIITVWGFILAMVVRMLKAHQTQNDATIEP